MRMNYFNSFLFRTNLFLTESYFHFYNVSLLSYYYLILLLPRANLKFQSDWQKFDDSWPWEREKRERERNGMKRAERTIERTRKRWRWKSRVKWQERERHQSQRQPLFLSLLLMDSSIKFQLTYSIRVIEGKRPLQ